MVFDDVLGLSYVFSLKKLSKYIRAWAELALAVSGKTYFGVRRQKLRGGPVSADWTWQTVAQSALARCTCGERKIRYL